MGRYSMVFAMGILLISGVWGSGLAQTEEELIAIVEAVNVAFNAHDLDLLTSYYANDAVFDVIPTPPPTQGKEAYRATLKGIFRAAPDMHGAIQRILVFGNVAVLEWVGTGTFEEEWMGIPPTGKSFRLPMLDIYDFEGDKVKRDIQYYDLVGWMIQVGLMPAGELPSLVPSITLPDTEPTGLSPMVANAEAMARWNTHDLARWAQMIRPDVDAFYNVLGIPTDRDGLVALNEMYMVGFSDIQGEVVRALDMGDGWILNEGLFMGTHDGPYMGVPATGKPMVNRVAWVSRYDADGVITHFHAYFDNLGVLVQIGAIPAPEPSAVSPSTWGDIKARFR